MAGALDISYKVGWLIRHIRIELTRRIDPASYLDSISIRPNNFKHSDDIIITIADLNYNGLTSLVDVTALRDETKYNTHDELVGLSKRITEDWITNILLAKNSNALME